MACVMSGAPLQSRPIHRRAGEPAIIISLGQAYPAFVALTADEGFASFALRLQRIEFPARAPPRKICGCRSRSGPFPSDECCSSPVVSLIGLRLGAERDTRSYGQTKEPRARPMRSGD